MHSLTNDGTLCVNLNDYNELSNSILWREKIDYLTQKLKCPKEITNFSISMFFHGGQRYYLSNLYLWAIPYRTEGLYRGDIDHDYSLYNEKEFFIQSHIKHDTMQIPIIQVLESRYKLHTVFAMIRQCEECDFIIESYNNVQVTDPEKFYYTVRDSFELFICRFLDAMSAEILTTLPHQKWLKILNDAEYRKAVITRKIKNKQYIPLTSRELQCLGLLSQGLNVQKIADKLHLSYETVNTHSKSIRQKLDSDNITEAVAKAFRLNLL